MDERHSLWWAPGGTRCAICGDPLAGALDIVAHRAKHAMDLWYEPCAQPRCAGHATPKAGEPRPKHGPHALDCDCDEPCWVPQDDWCSDRLMEDGWEDGFTCTRLRGHPGDHACFTTSQEDWTGTNSVDGRKYHWAHVWRYDDDPSEDQWPAGWLR